MVRMQARRGSRTVCRRDSQPGPGAPARGWRRSAARRTLVIAFLVSIMVAASGNARAAETITCDYDPFVVGSLAVWKWTGASSVSGITPVAVESQNPACVVLAARGAAAPPDEPSIVAHTTAAGKIIFRFRCLTGGCDSVLRLTADGHDDRECTVSCSAGLCRFKKGALTGLNALDLLKAFGQNAKTPNGTKLASDISKAQSKLTKRFTTAEFSTGGVPRFCDTFGDVGALEAKSEALVQDVLDEIQVPSSTTTTTIP